MDGQQKKILKKNPRENTNIVDILFFWWTREIFYKGATRDLEIQDLYEPLNRNRSEILGERLEREWRKELADAKVDKDQKKKKRVPSLLASISRVFFWRFMWFGFLTFVQQVGCRILQTVFLGWLITYFDRGSTITKEEALFYAAGIVTMTTTAVLLGGQVLLGVEQVGMEIRVACSSLVYRKVLRLSKSSLGQTAGGQIVNLLSNDVQRFDLLPIFLHYIWIMPIEMAVIALIVWQDVGVATLAGIGAMTLQTIPVQSYLSKLSADLREKIAHKTDARVQLMSELIGGIQVVKMYAWEKPFALIIRKIRQAEMKLIAITSYLRGFCYSFSVFTERVTLFVTLLAVVLIGNDINAKMVFTMATYWNILQVLMTICFPQGIICAGEALISVRRIQEFLLLEENESRHQRSSVNLSNDDSESKGTKRTGIVLHKVSANWTHGELPPTLNNLSFEVEHGKLCALIGPVGSGKSSILQLILGELPLAAGTLTVGGKTISYASQESWLFLATVRENILFGLPYDKDKYNEITRVCALEKDFEQFPRGDMTLVGERGTSLSGGQRARINLARAVYRDADVYLLDDPLSAVDTHVGKHLFKKCINGYLQNKTRILVTHQLQYLKNADTIVILVNGIMENYGNFDDLVSTGQDFANLLNSHNSDAEERRTSARSDVVPPKLTRPPSLGLVDETEPEEVDEEEVAKGRMSSEVYQKYFRAGGNCCLLFSVILGSILAQLATSGVDYWVTFWTNQESVKQSLNTSNFQENTFGSRYENASTLDHNATDTSRTADLRNLPNEYELLTTETSIYIYAGLILLCIILSILRNVLFFKVCMNASINLHGIMFQNFLQATMQFFNTNPSGRILNRFSKDIGAMDELLPKFMIEALTILSLMFGSLVMIGVSNYWMTIPILFICILLYIARIFYLSTAQGLKRLEGIRKSPMFSHMNSSLDGLTTIRSSGAELRMIEEFDNHQNFHTAAWYLHISTGTAFGFFVDAVVTIFIAIVCFTFILIDDGTTYSGNVGLAISQCLALTEAIQFGIRNTVLVVAEMTSAERILQYTNLPKEDEHSSSRCNKPPPSWPSNGAIEFKHLSMKYNDDDPPVLKDLNISIEPGQKVGIVGRTGAGKSSLISALFRLAKLDGVIEIDRINTQEIGLNDLRKRISIIPQEPVLFTATLRDNLDPFHDFDDEAQWAALEEVELKNSVSSLDFEVNGGGTNFSLGQRQLVCLARAILRNSRVLILDEATANVDPQTDNLIQSTIRKKFADCTVLTIAHRLNTIMDSDRVLVMDAGHAVEYDHPHVLLENPDGCFTKMLNETGAAMTEKLRNIARDSYNACRHLDVTIHRKEDN